MQSTRAIRNPREIACVERGRLQEGEHTIIHRWPRQLHQVIHQRVTAAAIRVQKPTREIEASGGQRLPCLPFEDGIGVVENRDSGIRDMACRRLKGEQRSAVYKTGAVRSVPFH
jgi:hypothetical protein